MWHLAIGMPGVWEILVIGGILLLLFGARKLPELARAMGSSITQFKKGLQDAEDPEKLPPGSPGEGGAQGASAEPRRGGVRE